MPDSTTSDAVRASISRRGLLTSAFAGGLVYAFRVPVLAANDFAPSEESGAGFVPNGFIRVDGQGNTIVVVPQVEMGQGIYTGLATVVAEELDADFDKVTVEHAPPNEKLYVNPLLGIQATGGSTSILAFWGPMRSAGATARAMLIQAAASRWGVGVGDLKTKSGQVIHPDGEKRLSYGELAEAAGRVAAPKDVPLKDPKDFVLIGKPLKRIDARNKVNGKTTYGIDVKLPGMAFATLAQSPVFGGKVAQVDDKAARAIQGVRQVIVLNDTVAVVGDHMWAAKSGIEALKISWADGGNANVDSEGIWADLRAASAKDGAIARITGDPAKALALGVKVEAAYEVPFLAHAAMEPLSCTVHVKKGSCEIWTGTQVIARAQSAAAKAAGLPLQNVIIHQHLMGGAFGRRLETDMIVTAVRIAKEVDGPVKIVWTREEDIQHDMYRPVYRDTLAATLSDGKVVGWKYKVAGAAVMARWLPPAYREGVDLDAVHSAADMPYDIPNVQVEFVRAEPRAVPTGFWRGVGPNNNVFAIECFMDELANRAGADPIAFRRSMLGKSQRISNVLDLVAEKSHWEQALPRRVGRGVSVQPTFGTAMATVVEAEIDAKGEILLRRVTVALDCGIAVNPDTIVAQIEGGMVFGLTAALYGEITINRGRVQQSNFHDYRMLRIDEVPTIEVHLVKSGEPPGGIGETGVVGGPPALRNAIYAATGVALRRLPIERELLAEKKQ
ncbi:MULTISPECIES: molybdopterin cofactor-binding domain-containing protein [unclassified Afipia]|uniref:xanthine dehydrogenase family protein molybdopterin-binding subunit n=1 Tax=unclassified Afipia TaxID=2642050 RepID=UPI0004640879|nr:MULTISPECIES: molybdopterin cofactor-binding domain-containing protein [unclassified Afipia]